MTRSRIATETVAGAEVRIRLLEHRGHTVVTEVRIRGEDVTPETLRRVRLARLIARSRLTTTNGETQPLGRPDGKDPATFYARVAEAYLRTAGETSHPCAVLAEREGVPVTSVHRWVREARRRGNLPEARRGAAG